MKRSYQNKYSYMNVVPSSDGLSYEPMSYTQQVKLEDELRRKNASMSGVGSLVNMLKSLFK